MSTRAVLISILAGAGAGVALSVALALLQ